MDELISKIDSGDLIALVAVSGGLLCGIVGIIMGCWVEMRRISSSTSLKQEMLERGLSADEIRTVLDAGANHSHKDRSRNRACA